jgi:uncharacterized membrane protein YeaQ/YmgE (transglycosylase-associated protein family)
MGWELATAYTALRRCFSDPQAALVGLIISVVGEVIVLWLLSVLLVGVLRERFSK